jgi:hypothetical protein
MPGNNWWYNPALFACTQAAVLGTACEGRARFRRERAVGPVADGEIEGKINT